MPIDFRLPVSEEPLPQDDLIQPEPTQLIPPNLKNEVIDIGSDEPSGQLSGPSGEGALAENFSVKCSLEGQTAPQLTSCSNLKPVLHPGFDCLQSSNAHLGVSVPGNMGACSAQAFGCPPKGAYFYHNQPKF